MENGKLIVIEGLDGSGKATQTKTLKAYFDSIQLPCRQISFPDYENPSSTLVKLYLAGEIGSLDEVNGYAAASFYSVDRYVSYQTIWKKDYLNGHTILADRYTTSNASHQMAKLPKEQWKAYLDWLWDFEYNRLGLPVPALVVYLDMHPKVSEQLLLKRYAGDEAKKDIHERNVQYSLLCREAALFAAQQWGWQVVACSDEENPLPVETIGAEILRRVQPMVSPK